MINLLNCKLCDYKSKQLFQHIKSKHNMSVIDYRNIFGQTEIMQLNFNPPDNKTIHKKKSDITKKSYDTIRNFIDTLPIHSILDTRLLLMNNDLYKNYFGKSSNRRLINDDPILYKSIMIHTDQLKNIFKTKEHYNFVKRIKFIVEYDYDIDKLKCKCGNKYTWHNYCRKCSDSKKTFLNKKHSDVTKLKMRLSTINYLKKCNTKFNPRYNKNSISIIEEYGIKHEYNFQHAENGGEYYIKELGYWLDAYDINKNIALEIDERHHFNNDGSLKNKDIIRQQKIEDLLKCKFIRIKYE